MKKKNITILLICFTLLFLSVILSLAFGAVHIAPGSVFDILWFKLSGTKLGSWSQSREMIVCHVRAPRALLALFAGGGLAVVGASMQATVRNPMADPYLLGLSSGASAGAALGISFGAMFIALPFFIPAMAFAGALIAFVLVYYIAKESQQLLPNRLILAGISISYLFASITSFLSFLAPEHSLREITYWLLGSVAAANWTSIPLMAIFVTAGLLFLLLHSKEFDVIVLGDETAVSLGVDPQRFRLKVFVVISLVTGVIVAETGAIGFVGLMIPHFVRLFGISDHKRLLLISFLSGAVFLIWGDVIARTILSPEELPIGIVTSMFGAPCFIWILKTTHKEWR